MNASLHLTRPQWDALTGHLLQFERECEQAAFAFVRIADVREPLKLEVMDLRLIQAHEFAFQSGYHLELAPETWTSVIRQAHALGAGLVDLHSHLGEYPAEFSASDRAGLHETASHVRWRLKQQPFVALVFTRSDFDALVWTAGVQDPEPLATLHVEHDQHRPTSITWRRWHDRHT